MATAERTLAPPHNLEAEQSVLGAILLSDRALYGLIISESLRADDFYREQHGVIYAAMLALYNRSDPVDVLTVTEELKQAGKLDEVGGAAGVHGLAGAVPAAGNARHYARIVRENALLRGLLTTTYTIQASVMNHEGAPRDLVDQAERAILEVAHDDDQKDFRSIDDILHDELEKLHALSLQKTSLTGTASGFSDLDNLTAGFQKGNLIVIAARPSMGKSALVANIAENAAIQHRKPVALFSLEMSEAELAQRFVASQSRTKGEELRKGRVKEREWPRVLAACQRLAEAPLFVDDSSDVGILEIRAKARRLHQQQPEGLGLVIVDYLQLMRADGRIESRVQQVGEMSRGLKILARELEVPVIALSQLSRAVETRTDKKPVLSDLRECVTGDSLVVLADGRRVPIVDLVGTEPDVVALDAEDRLVTARSDRVWRVGTRPVMRVRLASGRTLRATAEHRIRTGSGWSTVDGLDPGDRVALARRLPAPAEPERWPDDHVALLGQLIGDGSYLRGQPMRYTTASAENSRAVTEAAERGFGGTVTRHAGRGTWHQLVISGNGTRWQPAGVGAWLKRLGIFDQRSHEKRVPAAAFRLADEQVALLLRHLWATDGTLWCGARRDGRALTRVAYSTNSPGLAGDVSALLLRLGIVARTTVVSRELTHPMHHVVVSDSPAIRTFLDRVGHFGPRNAHAAALRAHLPDRGVTNVDTLPVETWAGVRRTMSRRGISQRGMAALRGTSYGGSAHFAFAPSRAVVANYGELLADPALSRAAASDLFWDRVVAVEPAGEEDVYDLTVPGPACWLADGIVSHNSGQIEQDADLVMFIYREEYYEPESEREGEADLIVAKHRNGALGTVTLSFQSQYPRFLNLARDAQAREPQPVA